MNRTLSLSLVSAGAFLCMQPAIAQLPGAGGPPGTGPSTPSTRNLNKSEKKAKGQ